MFPLTISFPGLCIALTDLDVLVLIRTMITGQKHKDSSRVDHTLSFTEQRGVKRIERTLTLTQVENMMTGSDPGYNSQNLDGLEIERERWQKLIRSTINHNVGLAVEAYKNAPNGFSGKVEDQLLGLEGPQAQQIWKLDLDSINELRGINIHPTSEHD